MGKAGAYLEYGRHYHGERPTEEAIHDFDDYTIPLSEEEQQIQASRCMMCGVAFCQFGKNFGAARVSGCPLHNLIPEWNDLVLSRFVGRGSKAHGINQSVSGVYRTYLPCFV